MAFLLLIPFFLVRFGLLSLLNKDAVKRAAYFAPLMGNEQMAYGLYQISNAAILVSIIFLKIKSNPTGIFFSGLLIYSVGLIILIISIINFSTPSENGFNHQGLYRISRNPMYVAYFIFFMGCVLLTQSLLLLAFVLLFQITAHWIIRSEERWCIHKFGETYIQYMKKVRRYI